MGPYERERSTYPSGAIPLSALDGVGPIELPEPPARNFGARWLALAALALLGSVTILIASEWVTPPTASLAPPSFTTPGDVPPPSRVESTRPVRRSP